jgi:phage I-like protein
LSSEIDSTDGKETTLVATYTMDDTVVSISKTDDGTTDASIALDYGTATLTAARNGGDAESSLTYKVSF